MVLAMMLATAVAQAPVRHPPEHPVLPQFYRPPTFGPGLSDVSIRASVRFVGREGGTLTMPLPGDYSGQIVIGFRVDCQPPGALRGWKWVNRPDGLNRFLQVSLRPGAGQARVTYTARVLTPGEDVVRTQRKDFSSWLAPTPLVPSKLPEISTIAEQLSRGAGERDEFAAKVAMWVANLKTGIEGTPFRLQGDLQTNSASRARLCAAILRNRRVPARVVAYFPTWAEGVDAAFWLVQYGTEERNWQAVDPTVGIVEPSRDTLVVAAICSLEDETTPSQDRIASSPERPKMSTPEVSPSLQFDDAGAVATGVRLIRSFPWQSGGRLMIGALARAERVVQSASIGESEWFDEATFKRVLAGGPSNLALFLGGRPTFPGHG